MATLWLYYSATNAAPLSTDPIHYRQFTVDYVNDREVEEVRIQHKMVDESIEMDLLGIRRKLHFHLRVPDIKANVEFLTSFLNAPFKWALVPDAGYYFNLGTIASPIPVPVVLDGEALKIDVPGLLESGIKLKSSEIYQRPSPPTISELGKTDDSVEVTFTGLGLVQKLYRSLTSGGTYVFAESDTDNVILHGGLNPSTAYYFKGTVVSIGGESELSGYISIYTLS
ncbi:hypothetical protein [Zoogloea sp.]|uniref:hypothetical protein n=1 Tax=Zoogloea sp. TaxID=49181 RepID=UPI00141588A1|nr:MAG: hypothetical protein F9K15_12700 [Zoogloea sp.]